MPETFHNRLLDALSPTCVKRLLAASVPMELPLGMQLFEREKRPRFGYFLTAGLGSVAFVSEGGTSIELETQGAEGFIGCSYLLGPAPKTSTCHMEVDGYGYRIPLAAMQHEFDTSAEVRKRVLEYVQHQYSSACQIAACNRLHRAEARFVRWLLMVADRLGSTEIAITQEFSATMLGARRTTVAEVCAELGRAGAIEGRRGNLSIVNRPILESRACECYPLVRTYFDALYQTPLQHGQYPE